MIVRLIYRDTTLAPAPIHTLWQQCEQVRGRYDHGVLGAQYALLFVCVLWTVVLSVLTNVRAHQWSDGVSPERLTTP
jgi:hypothetical protein